jgi:hypothetical protein
LVLGHNVFPGGPLGLLLRFGQSRILDHIQ